VINCGTGREDFDQVVDRSSSRKVRVALVVVDARVNDIKETRTSNNTYMFTFTTMPHVEHGAAKRLARYFSFLPKMILPLIRNIAKTKTREEHGMAARCRIISSDC
jgi:hypothetical protein